MKGYYVALYVIHLIDVHLEMLLCGSVCDYLIFSKPICALHFCYVARCVSLNFFAYPRNWYKNEILAFYNCSLFSCSPRGNLVVLTCCFLLSILLV